MPKLEQASIKLDRTARPRDVSGGHGESAGTRARLLSAAGKFVRSSYEELSVATILKEAEVQAPTLYHHFGDKEGLYVAWAVEALEELGLAIRSSVRGGLDLSEGLGALARAVANPQFPALHQIGRDLDKLKSGENREKIAESLQRAVFEPLYTLLLSGMEEGRLRTEPVTKMGAFFLAGAGALRPEAFVSAGIGHDGVDYWVDRFLNGFRR